MRSFNFARWNHILIPATKDGRDRVRGSLAGRVGAPLLAPYSWLTDEGRMASLLALLVAGFGLDVVNTELYLLAGMLWAIVIASMAVRPWYAIDGVVRAEVDAVRRVFSGEELELRVTLINTGPRDLRAVRITGPFLPWDGSWSEERAGLPLLARAVPTPVVLRARFTARGEHHLDPIRASALVPFALAQGKGCATSGTRFIVLPRPARVTHLSLPAPTRGGRPTERMASRGGESMDLMGVRPYRRGDPLRHLHARSWARTGAPVVREFEEDVAGRVAVLLDVGGGDERTTEAAIALTAGVVARLATGEQHLALLQLGDRVHDLSGRGRAVLDQALDLLACLEPRRPVADPPPPMAALASHLARLSCVVVVDAGRPASAVGRLRSAVDCLWLRVGRGPAGGTDATGARWVDPEAIERQDALAL